MNKKILIGSIIVIAILIGVSFTSVVGYRNVQSNAKASPLFNIRCSRAIDEESGDLRCQYVGKGEEITIPIPKRNETNGIILKAIKEISQMDEDKLRKLTNIISKRVDIDNFQKLIINSEFLKVGEDWTNDFLGAWGFDCLWAIFVFTILSILATPFIIISIPVVIVSVLLALFIGSIAIIGGILWLFITSAFKCDITFGPLSSCPNTLCGC